MLLSWYMDLHSSNLHGTGEKMKQAKQPQVGNFFIWQVKNVIIHVTVTITDLNAFIKHYP